MAVYDSRGVGYRQHARQQLCFIIVVVRLSPNVAFIIYLPDSQLTSLAFIPIHILSMIGPINRSIFSQNLIFQNPTYAELNDYFNASPWYHEKNRQNAQFQADRMYHAVNILLFFLEAHEYQFVFGRRMPSPPPPIFFTSDLNRSRPGAQVDATDDMDHTTTDYFVLSSDSGTQQYLSVGGLVPSLVRLTRQLLSINWGRKSWQPVYQEPILCDVTAYSSEDSSPYKYDSSDTSSGSKQPE